MARSIESFNRRYCSTDSGVIFGLVKVPNQAGRQDAGILPLDFPLVKDICQKIGVALILVACSYECIAQSAMPHPAEAASAAQSLAPVVVRASRDDIEAAAPISKTIIGSDDLRRFSDSALSEVLRRTPGVIVTENRARQPEVRLQGLPGAYTQILLNGQSVPKNFSLDSIPPQIIERIEISRTTLSESSGEGIAGTVNIVLKRAGEATKLDMRADAGAGPGGYITAASGTSTLFTEATSRSVTLSVRQEKTPRDASFLNQISLANEADRVWVTRRKANWVTSELAIVPALRATLNDGSLIVLDGVASTSYQRRSSDDVLSTSAGPSEAPAGIQERVGLSRFLLRLEGKHSVTLDSGGSIDSKIGGSYSSRNSRGDTDFLDSSGVLSSRRHLVYPSSDTSSFAGVKYSLSSRESHAMAVGMDLSTNSRREQDQSFGDISPPTEEAKATVNRAAIFAQDEIALSKGLSLYLGLREELIGIRVSSSSNQLRDSTELFGSPTARLTWQPNGPTTTIRIGVSETYKLPPISDLTPRRYYSNNNNALSPDIVGDPNLPIERSTNFDASSTSKLSSSESFSIGISHRRLRNATATQLVQDVDGRWLSAPIFGGAARVTSIDISYRNSFPLPGGTLLLNSSVNRNWSRVSWLSTPNNRISDSLPFACNLLVEYGFGSPKTALAANISYQRSGISDTTSDLSMMRSSITIVDLSMGRKITDSAQIKLAIANVLGQAVRSASTYRSVSRAESEIVTYDPIRTFRLSLVAAF